MTFSFNRSWWNPPHGGTLASTRFASSIQTRHPRKAGLLRPYNAAWMGPKAHPLWREHHPSIGEAMNIRGMAACVLLALAAGGVSAQEAPGDVVAAQVAPANCPRMRDG
jgi:hypothetical protein